MLRRYNLERSDNFPATGAAVILSGAVVLEDEDLALTFSPTGPSLVTRINLSFSRGNFLSDIDASAYITGATPVTLFSETDCADKIAWILSPQTPIHMLSGDYIEISAKISESTKSSSSVSTESSSSSSSLSSRSISSESSSSDSLSLSSLSSTSSSYSLWSSLSTEQILPEYICVTGAGLSVINGTYQYQGSNSYLNLRTGAILNSGVVLPQDWTFAFDGEDKYLSGGSYYRPEGLTYTSIDPLDDPPPEVVIGSCPSETSSQSSTSMSSTSISNLSSSSSDSTASSLNSISSSSSSVNSSSSSSRSSVMTSISTESSSSSLSSSLNSSSTLLKSTSSISSTGQFRVTYEIHYIPLYQLSSNETARTSTLT